MKNCIIALPFIDFPSGDSYRLIEVGADRQGLADLFTAMYSGGSPHEGTNKVNIQKPKKDAISRTKGLFERHGMECPDDMVYMTLNSKYDRSEGEKNTFASDLLRTNDRRPSDLEFHGAVALFSESLWEGWEKQSL